MESPSLSVDCNMVWTRLLPLIATAVTGAVAEAAVLKQCVAPHLRQNCPGTEGGQAGCEQRGCCFDNTRGGDWCSHFDPAPPAPPPPAPTAVVWEQCSGPMRGDDCARVGGRCDCVKVHASGGASLWLDGAQWITERPPGVCADLFAGFLSVDGEFKPPTPCLTPMLCLSQHTLLGPSPCALPYRVCYHYIQRLLKQHCDKREREAPGIPRLPSPGSSVEAYPLPSLRVQPA